MRTLTLAVVGADYPNARGPTRRFEIALCLPSERIELRPEPRNPKDSLAIAVYSARGVQLGYITAERAPLIHKLTREAGDRAILPIAVFQERTERGALIRVSFDGSEPELPSTPPGTSESEGADPHAGFYPDWIPPDD